LSDDRIRTIIFVREFLGWSGSIDEFSFDEDFVTNFVGSCNRCEDTVPGFGWFTLFVHQLWGDNWR
jgi:hypothetical protein